MLIGNATEVFYYIYIINCLSNPYNDTVTYCVNVDSFQPAIILRRFENTPFNIPYASSNGAAEFLGWASFTCGPNPNTWNISVGYGVNCTNITTGNITIRNFENLLRLSKAVHETDVLANNATLAQTVTLTVSVTQFILAVSMTVSLIIFITVYGAFCSRKFKKEEDPPNHNLITGEKSNDTYKSLPNELYDPTGDT